jgi:hypothetical protein
MLLVHIKKPIEQIWEDKSWWKSTEHGKVWLYHPRDPVIYARKTLWMPQARCKTDMGGTFRVPAWHSTWHHHPTPWIQRGTPLTTKDMCHEAGRSLTVHVRQTCFCRWGRGEGKRKRGLRRLAVALAACFMNECNAGFVIRATTQMLH